MSTSDHSNASIYPPISEVVQRPRLPQHTSGQLRRSTLVILRWLAIVGQSLTLIFVAVGLGFSFPIWPCVVMIGLSVLINLIVSAALPLDRRVGDFEAGAQLGYDLIQLAVLIWLTGGMSNPFALLFLAPVVTSATTLSRPVLIAVGTTAIILSFALLFSSLPVPWTPTGSFEQPFLFTLGVWFALIIGMAFTSMYAWRSAKESRRMSEALAATEAVLSHEQKLAALGGLAAAAAHELGTPLATIQLTAKEMLRELDVDTPLGEDALLMVSQTQRCRDILKQLALRGDEGDLIHNQMSLESLLDEVVSPFLGTGPEIELDFKGDGPAPVIQRQAEIVYAIKNLTENAVGFARDKVSIAASWTPKAVEVNIQDDGPGFSLAVIDRLGEPYVSDRPERSQAGGLGLGLFIAKTLIERTGGKIKFDNHIDGGAHVKIVWPRDRLSFEA